tara:strand:+ start:362 stop:562 length:201 start_codon:yes stop_codon:yes gene_type:complete
VLQAIKMHCKDLLHQDLQDHVEGFTSLQTFGARGENKDEYACYLFGAKILVLTKINTGLKHEFCKI